MRKGFRRDYQRKLTKKLREVNKSIEEDNLWRGRFVVRQKGSDFENFDDKSGGLLHTILRVIDKKTGYYHDYRLAYAPYLCGINWEIYMDIVNNFITRDSYAWQIGNPEEDKTDYTKMEIPVLPLIGPYNFYYSYIAYPDFIREVCCNET